MDSKKYFYSDRGIDQNGPFSLEELKTKEINGDTLIWFDGEPDWKPLKMFPGLLTTLKSNESRPFSPPPLPKTSYNSLQIKANPTLILFIWTAIHLFALLMSYTNIKFFNAAGQHQKEEFWPFVEFTETVGYTHFNHGLFYQYDWTEFALYAGAAWIIFLLIRISAKQNKL